MKAIQYSKGLGYPNSVWLALETLNMSKEELEDIDKLDTSQGKKKSHRKRIVIEEHNNNKIFNMNLWLNIKIPL